MGFLNKRDEDLTITRKMPNGASVTYKSPEGSQMEMDGILGKMMEGPVNTQSSAAGYEGGGMIGGPYYGPVEDNVDIRANPGEFVVNVPASQKYSGLLEQINNEGKQMLREGGHTAPKPGYAWGGWFGGNEQPAPEVTPEDLAIRDATSPFGGYAGYGQEDYLREAGAPQDFGGPQNLQGPIPTAPIEAAPEAAPVEPTVVGRPDVPVGQLPAAEPEEPFISDIADSSLQTAIQSSQSPTALVSNINQSIDGQIDDAEGRRDSVRIMMFGLGLLTGEGVSASVQAANAAAQFDQKKVDQLYLKRRELQQQVLKERYGAKKANELSYGDQGFLGTDKKVYFQGSDGTWYDSSGARKADEVDLRGKVGTVDVGDLSARLQAQVNAAQDNIDSAKESRAKITNILRHAPGTRLAGVFGRSEQGLRNLFGSQDEVSVWRTQVRSFINSDAIANLPPGVASDKDIELVLQGTLDGFANEQALSDWMAAVDRLNSYAIRYYQGKVAYIEDNRGIKGFEAPDFDPSVDRPSGGVTGIGDDQVFTIDDL